ncbi:MAG: O-antigen ligase family protein [Candidatus Baltobacteraceae bacterium]
MAITTTSTLAPRVVLGVLATLAGASVILLLVFGVSPAALALVCLAAGPIGLYVAYKRPLDFPLGLYMLLIPFDNLLGTGSFGTLTKLLGMVSGAFLLLWVVRHRRLAITGRAVVVLLALVVWMFASAFWAIDQGAALQIMATYAGLMGLYVVLTMMPVSPAQFRTLLLLVVAGAVCAALYGIHAFYQNPSFAQESPDTMRMIIQVGQNYIDPNHFSDALLFPIAIVTMWGLRARRIVAKLPCLAALAIFVTAILYSGSREGLTAMLVIATYYFWRSRYRLQLALGALAIVTTAATTQTSVWLRFSTALATGGSGRTSIWAVAVEAAKHRLLQGYGVGNFTQAFDLFYLGVHQPYPYGWESPAHNLVLHYLVELGVVGIGLIAAFFVFSFRSLREIKVGSELYDYRVMMEAALIATAVVSMTIDLFTYKYAWLVFSMIALLRNAAASYQSAPMRATNSSMIPALSARFSTRALPDSPSVRSSVLPSSAS